ncbi:hypothetical protein O3P69_019795 [Scylla paramamosain]|uniref:Ran-specific GTPase-activating protein n=1 Tax=Scylla paramamosain TaxID=85552 RepID=A0AAW0SY78_SCYPA
MAPEKTDPDDSVVSEEGGSTTGGVDGGEGGEHDPYFEPVVTLPEVFVVSDDDQEEEMIRLRCKLFRYHTSESPPEWKERGTGDIKILRNKQKKAQVRLVMRQDKTLKIRANHYITPYMELKPNCGSDRAFVWSVVADFADEEPKQELFAARFANAENARFLVEQRMQHGTARYGESTVALRALGPGPGAAYPMFSLDVAILIVTKDSRKSHHIFHLVYNQLSKGEDVHCSTLPPILPPDSYTYLHIAALCVYLQLSEVYIRRGKQIVNGES